MTAERGGPDVRLPVEDVTRLPHGKVALITAAISGIDRAAAVFFAGPLTDPGSG